MTSNMMSQSVRQADVAKAWGLSRQTVSRYVKDGMPLDSMEAAAAWRLRVKGKAAPGYGGKAPEFNYSTEEGGAPMAARPVSAGCGSLVERVRQTEMEIWNHLQGATGFEEQRNLLRLHKEAAATRVKVEAEQMELDVRAGMLVEFEEAKAFVRNALAPLAVGLRGMASRLAVKANPGRPDMAERVIEEEVQRLLSGLAEAVE
jgi:hypothetical protein